MDTAISEHAPKPAPRAGVKQLRMIHKEHRKLLAKRHRIQRILFGIFLTVIGIYVLNALVLLLFAPRGIETGAASYEGSEVIRMDSISVGIGPFEVEAAGYVNMATADDRFYISDVLHADHQLWETTAYSHEYFHLLQRNLVAEAAGGYPSYINPIRSFIYYFQLLRLNSDLASLMPAPAQPLPFTGGLEGSADCYAQPRGTAENPAYYTGVYIREDLCDSAQIWIVEQMAAGHWPEAPSEATALPEIFVEGGFPGKAMPENSKDGSFTKPIFKRLIFPLHRNS